MCLWCQLPYSWRKYTVTLPKKSVLFLNTMRYTCAGSASPATENVWRTVLVKEIVCSALHSTYLVERMSVIVAAFIYLFTQIHAYMGQRNSLAISVSNANGYSTNAR